MIKHMNKGVHQIVKGKQAGVVCCRLKRYYVMNALFYDWRKKL